MRSRKGFTLVEIMIVVAIIGLLVAIAIPNLLRARLSANESAAEGGTRTLITAIENFRSDQNPPSYPTNLIDLADPADGGLSDPAYVDGVIAGGQKQGYTYAYASVDIDADGTFDTYTLNSDPVNPGVTGNNHYYTDETGVIRVNAAVAAGPADNPLE